MCPWHPLDEYREFQFSGRVSPILNILEDEEHKSSSRKSDRSVWYYNKRQG